ncbi:MAG: hypothetical protein ABI232_04375 [Jatrophihabitantaceae bacterium]
MRKLVAAAFAGILLVGPSILLSDTSSAQAQPTPPDKVQVQVLTVDPNSPAASTKPQPLTFMLSLTNATQAPLTGLTITAERGDPIGTQQALDHAIADPQPPTDELAGNVIKPDAPPLTASLPAGATIRLSIHTDSDIPQDAGLCICHDAIYPIYFTVQQQAEDGSTATLGTAQTYLPAFKDPPRKVQVGWIWPLLERPHRLLSQTAFTDDQLAQSVAGGGRLDRLLQVAEQVGATVPMTLVIDPELLAELQTMTTGYQVQESDGSSVAGTGGAAAADWLSRLRGLLDTVPQMEVDLTPYADPDISALVGNGLSWATTMPTAMQDAVMSALGRRLPDSDIAWPAGNQASQGTLAALVQNGARAVVLAGQSVSAPSGQDQVAEPPSGLAQIRTASGSAVAALVSPSVDRYVGPALALGGNGLKLLPELVSEVAIRAIDPASAQYVLLVPPRDLNPDLAVSVRALRAVAQTAWSSAVPLRSALDTTQPTKVVTLLDSSGPSDAEAPGIQAAQQVTNVLPGLTSMFTAADAHSLLGTIPAGVQRVMSNSWAVDPDAQLTAINELQKRLTSLQNGVHLVKPTNGTYTLGSNDSPLPITIDNTLGVTVSVRIQLSTVGNLPGFKADDLGVQSIPTQGKLQLHVPVHVDRAGRIPVQVVLYAPAAETQGGQLTLGESLQLSVHSTALGDIGKVITLLAAVVLALALLVRIVRRVRAGRASIAPLDADAKAALLSGDLT